MKRVLITMLTFAAVALFWTAPASSQAAIHYGEGTFQFGSSDVCDVTLTYDGDLPGSGPVTDLTLPNGCIFGGFFPFEISQSDWIADFDYDADAELEGDLRLRISSLVDCRYQGTLTGDWDGGSGFNVSGSLTRIGGSFLCPTLTSTNDLNLDIYLVN